MVTNITASTIEIKDLSPEIHIQPGQTVDLNYWFSTKELNESEQLKGFLKQNENSLQITEGSIPLTPTQAFVFLAQTETMIDPMFNLDIARLKNNDEFIGKDIDNKLWARTISGGGGRIKIANDKIGGQLLIQSGKGVGRSVSLHTNGKTYYTNHDTVLRMRFRVEDISDSYSEIGFNNKSGQIRFERVENGNWEAVCQDDTGETRVDTGIISDQDFHWFGIRCRCDGVDFYVDGEYKTTITTNIPNGSLEFFVYHETSNGKSTRKSYIDAIYIDGGRE
jgi:hypothetical protein